MPSRKLRYIAALDIGSFKVSCFVAQVPLDIKTIPKEERLSHISIVASSEMPSRGIRHGAINDMNVAENIVGTVIENAEIEMNAPIDRVWINSSAGEAKAHYTVNHIATDGVIDEDDMDRLFGEAISDIYDEHDYIMHAIPLKYLINDGDPVSDPVGMRATRLEMRMMAITAQLMPLRNLGLCIEKNLAEIGGRAISPYASALGSLVPSEMKIGAVCVDIGADTSSVAVYKDDRLIFADVLKIGGNHITRDISQYFSTPMASAEYLKCEKGTCQIYGTEHDHVQLPVIGENFNSPTFETISRSELVKVIRLRTEEIIETIYDRLRKTGLVLSHYKLVLTGGTAQLAGFDALVKQMLQQKTRIACPLRLNGMPQSMSGPAYSVLSGLLSYAILQPEEIPPEKLFKRSYDFEGPKFKKIIHWLKHNF